MTDRLFTSAAGGQTATDATALDLGGGTFLGYGGGIVTIDDYPLTTIPDLLVVRELNSMAIASSDAYSAASVDRSFASQADMVTSDQSSIRAERRLASTVNNLFTGISDIEATRAFNSAAAMVTSTASAAAVEFRFDSIAAPQISTASSGNAERDFVSSLSIATSTVSELIRMSSFASLAAISVSAPDFELKYKIAGYKKLEYLTDSFVPDHIQYYNPKYKDLVRVFLRFLDYNSMFKTLNLASNNDLNKIFTEFLDYYLDQYLYGMVDLSKYELTDRNKQLFLLLSRILNNSKGTRKAFSYLFNSLTDIRIANEDVKISVDKIVTEFIEDESWWDLGDVKYHDGVYLRDGSITYEAEIPRPFTYQFKIDQSRETMLPLIRSVHPAGFQQEFLIEMDQADSQSTSDLIDTTTTYYHFYSYGVSGKTWYTHDGSIDRSGSHQVRSIG